MTGNALLAFGLFAVVSSITPGPNNLMLLASGMNFGFRASIPHMLGICIGFFIVLMAIGLGLGGFFAAFPLAYNVVKWAGVIYLLYLAWRIATAGSVSRDASARGKPLSFIEAALFQWVNPKALAMAISAFSTYIPPAGGWRLALSMSGLYAMINLPCVSTWTLFGSGLERWLQRPGYARIFNLVMAVLLLASLVPVFAMQGQIQ